MIKIDDYLLSYLPHKNKIEIELPQTWETLADTITEVSRRRVEISDAEQAAILLTVIRIFEERREE